MKDDSDTGGAANSVIRIGPSEVYTVSRVYACETIGSHKVV